MNINPTSFISSVISREISTPHKQAKTSFKSNFELAQDTFSRSGETSFIADKYTIQKFKKDIEETPEIVSDFIKSKNICIQSINEAANEHTDIGLKLKKVLDRKYGEGKYVFVSIGRSPAALGRVLEFSGVETKYIPISGLGRRMSIMGLDEKMMKQYFKEIAAVQSITPEKVASSDKKYLFFDVAVLGRSLREAKNIFNNDIKLPENRTEYLTLNEYLRHIMGVNRSESYIGDMMVDVVNIYAGYPGLYHFEHDTVESAKNHIANYTSKEANIFNMFVMNNLKSKGLLKENPLNRSSL